MSKNRMRPSVSSLTWSTRVRSRATSHTNTRSWWSANKMLSHLWLQLHRENYMNLNQNPWKRTRKKPYKYMFYIFSPLFGLCIIYFRQSLATLSSLIIVHPVCKKETTCGLYWTQIISILTLQFVMPIKIITLKIFNC